MAQKNNFEQFARAAAESTYFTVGMTFLSAGMLIAGATGLAIPALAPFTLLIFGALRLGAKAYFDHQDKKFGAGNFIGAALMFGAFLAMAFPETRPFVAAAGAAAASASLLFAKQKTLLGIFSTLVVIAGAGLAVTHSLQHQPEQPNQPISESWVQETQGKLQSYENSIINGLDPAEFKSYSVFNDNIKFQLAAANLTPDSSAADIEKALGLPPDDVKLLQNFMQEMDKAAVWLNENPEGTYYRNQPPQALLIPAAAIEANGGGGLFNAVYRGDVNFNSGSTGEFQTLAYSNALDQPGSVQEICAGTRGPRCSDWGHDTSATGLDPSGIAVPAGVADFKAAVADGITYEEYLKFKPLYDTMMARFYTPGEGSNLMSVSPDPVSGNTPADYLDVMKTMRSAETFYADPNNRGVIYEMPLRPDDSPMGTVVPPEAFPEPK